MKHSNILDQKEKRGTFFLLNYTEGYKTASHEFDPLRAGQGKGSFKFFSSYQIVHNIYFAKSSSAAKMMPKNPEN